MRTELYEELFLFEETHWWLVAKRNIVLSLLRRYLRREPGRLPRVCDVGCGSGIMLKRLKDRYEACGIDASPEAIGFCRRRGLAALMGSLPDNLAAPGGDFDAVLLLDVLEHVRDDARAAGQAADLLRPGGILVVTVPALPFLWTKRDEFHAHQRRYTRDGLRRALAGTATRKLVFSSYCSLLFPAVAAARVASRWLGRDKLGPDLFVPPEPVNGLLRLTFELEKFFLPHVPLPWGSSLVYVGRRH